MSEKKTHILIVDCAADTEQFLSVETIRRFREMDCELMLEKTEAGARGHLNDTSKPIRVLILAAPREGLDTAKLLPEALKARGAHFPVYVLQEPENAQGMPEVLQRRVPIKHYVGSKLAAVTLLRVLAHSSAAINQRLIQEMERELGPMADGQIRTGDRGQFIGIEATTLLSSGQSPFNVFIRIGDSKFIRVVSQGDEPDPEQITKYVNRGVELLYVRKEIQELYVRYCDQVSKSLISDQSATLQSKISHTFHHGSQTLELLRTEGLDVDNVEYASEYVANLGKVVRQMNLVEADQLAAFLGVASRYEHNTSVAAMAGLLAKSLNLGSDKSSSVIGLAGLFHDIGLVELKMYDDAHHICVDGISSAQRAAYESHAALGAKILTELQRFEPTVIQAISQHHIRKDGSGFPSDGSFTHIHLCAEIIGICDEFDYILRRKHKNPAINIRQEVEKLIPRFSRQVIKAFQATFLTEPASPHGDGAA
jgi:putative nucleotidyltransferase with HDIG domain